MPLLQLQHEFMDYLIADREGSASVGDVAAGIRAAIVDDGQLGVTTRLHIYHHAYRARLVEVMQDVFERTWAYLGDDGFASAANGYVESSPSALKTLNRYGEQFPNWLTGQYPVDPEIAEIAEIDWMMRVAFDGEDQMPMRASALSALTPADWATISFSVHKTVSMTSLRYNAARIWESLERGQTPPDARELEVPACLIVWRKDLRPHFVAVSTVEGEALALLKRGHSFAVACEQVAANHPSVDMVQLMGGWLRRWLDEELLVSFSLANGEHEA